MKSVADRPKSAGQGRVPRRISWEFTVCSSRVKPTRSRPLRRKITIIVQPVASVGPQDKGS